ncbi:TPA: Rhs-family protein [Salmonella enterica]|nr:Rhs-family protein [Salmonella enterica]
MPLARVDKAGANGPNKVLYFHTDVNGAPEEMTDCDGEIVWETGYQVWGNTIQEKDHGGVEQNLRYQGQYLDRETGLHYNIHRYFDPDVGRFTTTDPISLAGGLNLYQYAPNPLGWIDPLGLANRPNNGKYHIFFEHQVDSSNRYSSDAVQFNRANDALIKRMNNDPAFRRDMLRRHPELGNWLKNGRKSSSPSGFTWHHHEDLNRLVLVDRGDHSSNSGLYHPTGKGGRDIWGGGEAGRLGKLNGATGKLKPCK